MRRMVGGLAVTPFPLMHMSLHAMDGDPKTAIEKTLEELAALEQSL